MIKRARDYQKFWIQYEKEEVRKLQPDVNTLHLLSMYLLKEALLANDLRFLKKNKIKYVQMWADWLDQLKPTKAGLREHINYVANTIVMTYVIYHNSESRKMSRRNFNYLKFKIKKHLESIID